MPKSTNTNKIVKKTLFIFIVAFFLNAIWENLHALLYENYMNGEITEFILLRATLADAIIITFITLPFIFSPLFKKHGWIIFFVGFIISVGIEWWALSTGRWTYNAYMPVIPILSVGLTPAIQLGLLGYFSFQIIQKSSSSKKSKSKI